MTEPKRTQLKIGAERALLVSVLLPGAQTDPHDPLGELRSLVKTARAEVVDEMVAKRRFEAGVAYRALVAPQLADDVEAVSNERRRMAREEFAPLEI